MSSFSSTLNKLTVTFASFVRIKEISRNAFYQLYVCGTKTYPYEKYYYYPPPALHRNSDIFVSFFIFFFFDLTIFTRYNYSSLNGESEFTNIKVCMFISRNKKRFAFYLKQTADRNTNVYITVCKLFDMCTFSYVR